MTSSFPKIIAVVGATGNQGSSVARTFLSLPDWHVRAITRNPSSEKAATLKALGAELVRADLSDIASLVRAFAGAHAIFLNTDFWEAYRSASNDSGLSSLSRSRAAYEKEVFHGKTAAIAAASIPTLRRLVYSSLVSIKTISAGKFNRSFHPESKATIVRYIEAEESELAKKMSLIIPAGYAANPMFRPTLDPKSEGYVAATPLSLEGKMPILDPSEAMGPFVRALVVDEMPGTKLLAHNEDSFLPFKRILQIWTEVTGKEVQVNRMNTEDIHKQLDLPWELLDGLDFVNEYGYDHILAEEGIIEPRHLTNPPKTKSYRTWLEEKPEKELLG